MNLRGIPFLIAFTLLLSACGMGATGRVEPPAAVADSPPPGAAILPEKVVSLATVTPPSPAETALPQDTGWKRVGPPGGEVTFELPAGWSHYGQEANWSPDGGATLIGLNQAWVEPGDEVEAALLPPDSQVLDASTLVAGSLSVRRFRTKEYQHLKEPPADGSELPLRGYAAHHFVRTPENTLAFDFMALAPDEKALAALDPVMQRVLESIQWGNLPVRP